MLTKETTCFTTNHFTESGLFSISQAGSRVTRATIEQQEIIISIILTDFLGIEPRQNINLFGYAFCF
jgi:hypothetical protein